jgi:hypothetical protein
MKGRRFGRQTGFGGLGTNERQELVLPARYRPSALEAYATHRWTAEAWLVLLSGVLAGWSRRGPGRGKLQQPSSKGRREDAVGVLISTGMPHHRRLMECLMLIVLEEAWWTGRRAVLRERKGSYRLARIACKALGPSLGPFRAKPATDRLSYFLCPSMLGCFRVRRRHG